MNELEDALQDFIRLSGELARDHTYGVRKDTIMSILRENNTHSRVYWYIRKENEWHAIETGLEATIQPIAITSQIEAQGGVRMTPEECQTELDHCTPIWHALNDQDLPGIPA
jgi:hypothetical protein